MDSSRLERKRKREAVRATGELLCVVDAVMDRCPWTARNGPREMVTWAESELKEIDEEIKQLDKKAAGCCPRALQDELGDLFFDAFLLAAQCARKHGTDTGAAIGAACAKVKRRCRHVFGDEQANTAEEAAAIWQRVKREEKARAAAVVAAAGTKA
eukprot:g2167.t1